MSWTKTNIRCLWDAVKKLQSGTGADEQQLGLTGDTLTLTNGGSVDLSNYRDLVRIFEGEDSGTTDTNRYNLSQGNGNEWPTLATAFGWGTVLPAPFEIEVVTIGARINPANGSQYQVTRSVGGAGNALVGTPMTLPGNTLASVYPQAITLAAGDVVNVWTLEAGATDCVACIWGRWL